MAKHHTTEPGYIAERHNQAIGAAAGGKKVVIYDRHAAGDIRICGGLLMLTPQRPDRYAIICKAHTAATTRPALPEARSAMKAPAAWCADCQALRHGYGATAGGPIAEPSAASTSSRAPAGEPGADYIHIPSLLASLAIDPALAPDVMRIVERHCNDIDNDPRRPTPRS